MANKDRPNGFTATQHGSGGSANRLSRYHIADGLAANLFRGDAVIPVTTTKNITIPGAATARLIGVFSGCTYIDTTGAVHYGRWPTGQAVQTGSTPDAWVYDDPKTIFEAQVTAGFTLADIGVLANPSLGAGNATTNTSGHEVDSSTYATGTVLKIVDYVRRPENEVGTNAKVLVQIALHYLGGGLTAI